MIVTDASAVIDVLVDPPGDEVLSDLLLRSDEALAAPDLLDVEVLSVLRRWQRLGHITSNRGRQALHDLAILPIVRFPARTQLLRAWALRDTLTAYDAQYVALAEVLPARLLTTDDRMARAARAAGLATVDR